MGPTPTSNQKIDSTKMEQYYYAQDAEKAIYLKQDLSHSINFFRCQKIAPHFNQLFFACTWILLWRYVYFLRNTGVV